MCLYLWLSLHNDAVHCSAAGQDSRDFLVGGSVLNQNGLILRKPNLIVDVIS